MTETLEQKYRRIMEELVKLTDGLNERQKDKDGLTADFYGDKARINHKIKRIIEIEKKLKTKRVSAG